MSGFHLLSRRRANRRQVLAGAAGFAAGIAGATWFQPTAAMQADPEWQAYLKASAEAGYLVNQQNQLMTPAAFAPIKR